MNAEPASSYAAALCTSLIKLGRMPTLVMRWIQASDRHLHVTETVISEKESEWHIWLDFEFAIERKF